MSGYYQTILDMLNKGEIVVLDGALGTLMRDRSEIDMSEDTAWGVEALLHDQRSISQIHSEYGKAGANIITTSSFRTNPSALKRYDEKNGTQYYSDSESLTKKAVELAVQVRADNGLSVAVAGSMTCVNDGFEKGASLGAAHYEEHFNSIKWLKEAGADFILLETFSHYEEIKVALKAARELSVPVWLSFSVDFDAFDRDRSLITYEGHEIEQIFDSFQGFEPDVVLENCSLIRTITPALQKLKEVQNELDSNLPLGLYPNFEVPPSLSDEGDWRRPDELTAQRYAELAKEWVDLGVSVVGGCCGSTPGDVGYLAEVFRKT